ncbi:MAG: nicotinate (nicotinamide) nucleotide adenylyltransferase [bacterium]
MRRALLGGSFDPFHNGHLAMVRYLLERGLADRVLVVPARQSPHKGMVTASAGHRLEMARQALSGVADVTVLDLESRRSGVSYTVETLEHLAGQYPGDELRLALGADNLDAFHTWRKPERILELARPVVFARRGWSGELPAELGERAIFVTDFSEPVSATWVRIELAAGRFPVAAVPAPVLTYIEKHDLYRTAAKA